MDSQATTALPILEDEQNLYDWGIENRLGETGYCAAGASDLVAGGNSRDGKLQYSNVG